MQFGEEATVLPGGQPAPAESSRLLAGLERALDGLALVPSALAALSVGLIVLLTLSELIARNLETSARLARPTSVTLMLVIAFFTLAEAERRWQHMRVDFFVSLLSPRWQAATQLLVYCVVLAFLGLLTVLGTQYANAARVLETREVATGWPLFLIYATFPIGTALMMIQVLRNLVQTAAALVRGELPPGRTASEEEEDTL